jgi:limonene-1,2-epoxide hydrolase
MTDNIQTIRDFIAAWSRLDADELVSYFTDDGVYHNMPTAPVSGHEGLRAFIGGFIASWTQTDWEVLTIIGEGDTVVAERLDRTRVGDIAIDLPCCGVFLMRDGKIAVWRDYFAMATFTKPLAG